MVYLISLSRGRCESCLKNNKQYILIIPVIIAIGLFLILPLGEIVLSTIFTGETNFDYWSFFKDSDNQLVILRTLKIAVITTIGTLLLSLPTALWISRQTSSFRKALSTIILFPILTNSVVRNFTWIIILGKNGVINKLMLAMNIIKAPLALLYTDFSIILGSIYLFLPIMITSLVSSLSELNVEVEEAGSVLGASPSTNFWQVILPQLTVGILTGVVLVFTGSMTAYTTPQILGGNKHLVMSTLIYQQALTLGDWTKASAIAVILIGLTVGALVLVKVGTKIIERRSAQSA